MNGRPPAPRHGLAHEARRLALVWLALLALMLASLGSAYLSLGLGNVVAGLAIAGVKAGLVLACFMRLGRAPAITRLAAAAGLATLVLLLVLSQADFATRVVEPARWQRPPRSVDAPSASSAAPAVAGDRATSFASRRGLPAHAIAAVPYCMPIQCDAKTMSAEEWVWRCAQRLRQRWPSPSIADLEEVAARLWQEPRWRALEPEEAAVRWLRLGALVH